MVDFNPVTRITSNNARGNKRRIGSSKRSSLDSTELTNHRKLRSSDATQSFANASGESLLPMLPGVGSFLHNQRIGSKGIRTKIRNATFEAERLQVSHDDYTTFCEYTRQGDPNEKYYKSIEKLQESQIANKVWLLLSEYNVLLYGLGCKRRILEGLVVSYLQGEDVLELNGENALNYNSGTCGGDRCIKILLNHISRNVLRHKGDIDSCSVNLQHQTRLLVDLLNIHYGRGSLVLGAGAPTLSLPKGDNSWDSGGVGRSSTDKFDTIDTDDAVGRKRSSRAVVGDSDRWGGRYALAQSKLYIVVPDITGPALCSETTQQCLSILAECRSVALIATVENLNSVVHWDRRALAAFAWSYHHVPTYEPTVGPSAAFPLICRDLEEALAGDGAPTAGLDNDDAAVFDAVSGEDSTHLEPTGSGSVSTGSAGSAPAASAIGVGSSKSSSTSAVAVAGAAGKQAPLKAASASLAGRSLTALTESVTANHNELIKLLVKAIQDKRHRLLQQARSAQDVSVSSHKRGGRRGAPASHTEGRINHETGVQMDTLLQLAKAGLIAKDLKALRNLLKEFLDHSVVTVISHQGQEYVCLKPPFDAYLQQDNLAEKIVSAFGKDK